MELAAEVNVRQVLMRYINRLSDCLYALARAEDSDAHQNNLIREISRRYLAASQPSRSKETTPVASHSRSTPAHPRRRRGAQRLQVPVVISIVDAHGTETVTWRMPDALLVSSELAPKKA